MDVLKMNDLIYDSNKLIYSKQNQKLSPSEIKELQGKPNWNKSVLQEKLEAEGWHFLMNDFDDPYFPYRRNDSDRGIERYDEELKEKYVRRGFKDVQVTDAYDWKGNPISVGMIRARAVYVKLNEGGK